MNSMRLFGAVAGGVVVVWVLFSRALYLCHPGRIGDALSTANDGAAGAYFDQGMKALDTKDYDGAIGWFTKVIDLDPRNAAARINRGVAYLQQKDYERAQADFDDAIRLE